MGFQSCSTHGVRYEDYGDCSMCITERLQQDALDRQTELLREQNEILRQQAARPNPPAAAGTAGNHIHADKMTNATLASAFARANIEWRIDADGDLVATERVSIFVYPKAEFQCIQFIALFRLADGIAESTALAAVNEVNMGIPFARASVHGPGLSLAFDVFIPEGITETAFISTFKNFVAVCGVAVNQHLESLLQ